MDIEAILKVIPEWPALAVLAWVSWRHMMIIERVIKACLDECVDCLNDDITRP